MKTTKRRVYLIGLGIPEITSMTLEAVAALKKCSVVFSAGAGLFDQGFLNRFCPDIRRIDFDYTLKDQDREARARIEVIFEALRTTGPAAFVAFGNPVFYDVLCQWIKHGCSLRGIPCEIVCGISAVDAVFSKLGIALLAGDGVRAGDLEYFDRNLPDPGSYALLFRPGKDSEKLKKIIHRCRDRYPSAHKVAFVRCASSTPVPERISWHRMQACARSVGKLDRWTSLLIPPTGRESRQRGGESGEEINS